MDQDDELGWVKDEDINGKEIYRPNLTQAALFMELICSGTMPQLEWRSPGRRLPPGMGPPGSPRKSSLTTIPQLPREPLPGLPASAGKAPATKPFVAQSSPFDFDDTEANQAAATRPPSISPTKAEPRKPKVGTLSNAVALQVVPLSDKSKDFTDSAHASTTTASQPADAKGALTRVAGPVNLKEGVAASGMESPEKSDHSFEYPETVPVKLEFSQPDKQ